MREHCHFYCDGCESVFDIDLPAETGIALPKGYKAERYDIAIHGRCPACATGQRGPRQMRRMSNTGRSQNFTAQ